MKKPPLEQISLSGYKSIRKLDGLRMDAGINALIGANGSGKTNFIRFFELLGHMLDPSKGLQNYISARGRADAFLFRGMKTTPELAAELTFGLNRYSFTLRAADDRSLFFSSEAAPFQGPRYGPSRYSQGSGHTESALTRPGLQPAVLTWVRDTLRGWRVYHFHDTSPSAAVMGLCNLVDDDPLHGDAGNLAAFLTRLRSEYSEHYARVVEAIRQVAPFFGDFVLKEVSPGQTQLLWKDRFCDLIYYPSQLSDGTLRYICLATLLLQPVPPFMLIIDEPELGLHPFAIRHLAGMLHEAATRTQLIVSTQSSLLIDDLTPTQIIVVDSQDGETALRRLDNDSLAEWLQDFTLGQLWEKNTLGGNP